MQLYELLEMITSGYVKTIDGLFHLEIRNETGGRLIGKKYRSLQSLKKSLPNNLAKMEKVENFKKHVFDNGTAVIACFAPNLIVYTSRFKNYKAVLDFVNEVRAFLSDKNNSNHLLDVCLEDYSENIIRIKKVSQFLDELEKITLPLASNFYFRGHSSYLYEMKPAIFRKEELIRNENVIYNELLIRCPNDFTQTASTFDVLVKMQHYSLPTRLLDITTNPLVALYFACSGYKNDSYDGEVKILSIPTAEMKYFDSDTVTLIANIAKQESKFEISCLDSDGNERLIHFLDDIKREKSYFTNRIKKKSLTSVICVKPKLNNARIIRQDGAFLIFGMGDGKMKPAKIPPKYKLADDVRFFVDNKSKESILMQLEKIGINEASIYPEIDKVSAYISNKYGKPVDVRDEQDLVIQEHKESK
ncbi:FRG domain-containing protein [Raoultella lignicola]|uniref:FRG domain-containing protein n=1 Tax=Raoultella lignicola TaxID=3040939 RepID=A0ABU9F9A4_9ENTR